MTRIATNSQMMINQIQIKMKVKAPMINTVNLLIKNQDLDFKLKLLLLTSTKEKRVIVMVEYKIILEEMNFNTYRTKLINFDFNS